MGNQHNLGVKCADCGIRWHWVTLHNTLAMEVGTISSTAPKLSFLICTMGIVIIAISKDHYGNQIK